MLKTLNIDILWLRNRYKVLETCT
uniref:Uncharacterized protein n=1 Tax=Arundo donax TaxID=35708 RepID=A0A0A8YY27_ARUDO